MAPTEMVQCYPPMPLPPTNAAPGSPGPFSIISLGDYQAMEMANAIAAMRVTSSASCSACQPPSGNSLPSRATEITPCSSTPCLTSPTKQSSSQAEFVQFAQQFLDILKSLSTKQGPPPQPAAADGVKYEEPPARASKLEFKCVDEVFLFRSMQVQP